MTPTTPTLAPTVAGKADSVMIELTNQCQLACITCPRDKRDAHDYEVGMMSVADFRRVFSQFEDTVKTLDLTGLGESLMHPQIFEIIRWTRSRVEDLHIFLTTNTILLHQRTLDAFRRDPVSTLCISIDGTNQAEFSSVRGRLHYDQLKRRVRTTVEHLGDLMDFILCVVLVKENLDSMPEFVDLAAELGIGRVSLKPINLVANAIPSTYYDLFLTDTFDLQAEESLRRGRVLGVDVSVFRIGTYTCTFPWNPIYITWDGYLVPCCAKPFPKRTNFGNLLTETFEAVKNSPTAVEFRKQLLGDDPPAFCRKCHMMEKTLRRD
jgi:radical SAM protein with 4Fe4S-binding SPASM domain